MKLRWIGGLLAVPVLIFRDSSPYIHPKDGLFEIIAIIAVGAIIGWVGEGYQEKYFAKKLEYVAAAKLDLSNRFQNPNLNSIATIWSRIGGAIVDLLIVFAVSAVLLFIWGIISGLNQENVSKEVWGGRGFLTGLVVDCLITIIPMSGDRQSTFGQRSAGVRTVRLDGEKITIGTAFIRYIVSLFSSIMLKSGFAIALFTKNKRTLHDVAAGTIVVKE